MQLTRSFCITLLVSLFVACLVHANPPIDDAGTYGPEHTFTSPEFRARLAAADNHIAREKIALEEMRKLGLYLMEKCAQPCEVVLPVLTIDELVVRYPKDGTWFKVHLDNDVLEVTGKPLTPAHIEQLEERTQKDIFNAMKEAIHLEPSPEGIGGGHVNQGVRSTFRGNARWFKGTIVDNANHPEIAVIHDRAQNKYCRVVVCLPDQAQQKFVDVMTEFDRNPRATIPGLADSLYQEVYKFDQEPSEVSGLLGRSHALNVVTARREGPSAVAEYRYPAPQRNSAEYTAKVQLIDARTRRVKRLLDAGIEIQLDLDSARRLMASGDKQAIVNRFYEYVCESGLQDKWDSVYRHMMRGPYAGRDVSPEFKKAALARLAIQEARLSSCPDVAVRIIEFRARSALRFMKN